MCQVSRAPVKLRALEETAVAWKRNQLPYREEQWHKASQKPPSQMAEETLGLCPAQVGLALVKSLGWAREHSRSQQRLAKWCFVVIMGKIIA